MWRVHLLSGLIACVTGGVLGFLTARFAGRSDNSGVASTQTVTLEGLERFDMSGPDAPRERVVYYKTPFASPPHVTIGEPHFTATDQKAESFKSQLNPGISGAIYSAHWKAEGAPAKQ